MKAGRTNRMTSTAFLPEKASGKLRKRYQDAYRVASHLVIIGTLVKIAGGILCGLLLLATVPGSFEISRQPETNPFSSNPSMGAALGLGGFVLALAVAAVCFLIGTHISAQGQILRAALDSAVNSSPFLSDVEKAEAAGLV